MTGNSARGAFTDCETNSSIYSDAQQRILSREYTCNIDEDVQESKQLGFVKFVIGKFSRSKSILA